MYKFFFLVALNVTASCLIAQNVSSLRTKHFNTSKGVALSGYDAVAYLKDHKAIKGKKDHAIVNERITYYFSSGENKEAFSKDPARYEPQYGGWCAYAMGEKGEKVSVDPETFKIIDGRLYLFYNRFFNNTLDDWNKDEAHLKSQADANWRKTFK